MRKILFILVLVLGIGGVSIAQTAQTQPSKEYVTALKKMIVVSGSGDIQACYPANVCHDETTTPECSC